MVDNLSNSDSIEELSGSLENYNALVNAANKAMNQHVQGIASELCNSYADYWQTQASQIAESAKKLSRVLAESITDIVSRYDFSALAQNFLKANTSICFLEVVREMKWPLFLIDDEEFKKKVVAKYQNKDNHLEMEDFFCNFCENDYFPCMEGLWANNTLIRQDRIPILQEAIALHRKQYYYASTSILMCQLYGIVSDIVDHMKKHNMELDASSKQEVAECFNMQIDHIDSEKGKMLQAIATVESGYLAWNEAAEYLKGEILCSSESKKKWAAQPLRNKICHGDQLNFGTRKHSVKAILAIDILMNLTFEIEYITNRLEETVT